MNSNILLLTDSYKLSHAPQYPDGTEQVTSYFEARVGAEFDETVFFGLQYYLKRYLEGQVITKEKIEEARDLSDLHVGPNVINIKGMEYILNKHGGILPIRIKAVKEGTPVPINNVMMTVENTDLTTEYVHWLTNYLETLLVQIWYPCTVASLSRTAKKMLLEHLKKSGTPENIDFMLHDFGVRGSTSMESAAIGGLAHLVNFKGTDNLPALAMGRKFYDCKMAGFSIPATEHSTITSHGQENELETYRRYLKLYPKGIIACVSDSWDIFKACKMWANDLKEEVLARDGKLVVRPDSGDPEIVDPNCINILGEGLGYDYNDKGYKILNPKIGVIQGDGCNLQMMNNVLNTMEDKFKQSSDNIVFGMGGALLQKMNRDTQRFAFKCCNVRINGKDQPVFKNPSSDVTKASKAGRLKLIKENDCYKTVNLDYPGEDLLELVFENGEVLRNQTLDEIRDISKIS